MSWKWTVGIPFVAGKQMNASAFFVWPSVCIGVEIGPAELKSNNQLFLSAQIRIVKTDHNSLYCAQDTIICRPSRLTKGPYAGHQKPEPHSRYGQSGINVKQSCC